MRVTGNAGIGNLSKFEICIIKDLRSMDFASLDAARLCIINLANAARGARHDKGIVNWANTLREDSHNKVKASIESVSGSGNVVLLKERKSRQQ